MTPRGPNLSKKEATLDICWDDRAALSQSVDRLFASSNYLLGQMNCQWILLGQNTFSSNSLRSLALNEQGVSNRGPNLKSVFWIEVPNQSPFFKRALTAFLFRLWLTNLFLDLKLGTMFYRMKEIKKYIPYIIDLCIHCRNLKLISNLVTLIFEDEKIEKNEKFWSEK